MWNRCSDHAGDVAETQPLGRPRYHPTSPTQRVERLAQSCTIPAAGMPGTAREAPRALLQPIPARPSGRLSFRAPSPPPPSARVPQRPWPPHAPFHPDGPIPLPWSVGLPGPASDPSAPSRGTRNVPSPLLGMCSLRSLQALLSYFHPKPGICLVPSPCFCSASFSGMLQPHGFWPPSSSAQPSALSPDPEATPIYTGHRTQGPLSSVGLTVGATGDLCW